MQLEQSSQRTEWCGSIPNAFDARVLALVVAVAALAASVNIPYGGVSVAVVAFALLAAGGIAVHLLGERRLRRLTGALVEQWDDAGAEVENVTRSSSRLRTEWTVHTADGPITVGGLALVPISSVSLEWQGIRESTSASDAEDRLERFAAEWYAEIFATPAQPEPAL